MAQKFYIGNYGGPLAVDVFAPDGVTPILPDLATIDIINMETGDVIVSGASCLVQSGLAYYVIPSGSSATATAGHFVGYINVLIEAGNLQTEEVYYNVYSKTPSLILDRWRAKVQDSAPDEDHIDDDAARDWIDQAVGYLNGKFDLGYTSVLGTLTPIPTNNDMEFIASTASLIARYSWWAGKGNWRDGEMSFNGTPFEAEWNQLQVKIDFITAEDWYSDTTSADMYNRDRVYYDGVKIDSPGYWRVIPGESAPTTDIPI